MCVHVRLLCCTNVLSFFLFLFRFWTPTQHPRWSPNGTTLSQIGNSHSKFWIRGAKKLPIFGGCTTTLWFKHEFGMNALDKPKKLNHKVFPTFPEIWWTLAHKRLRLRLSFYAPCVIFHGAQGGHHIAAAPLCCLVKFCVESSGVTMGWARWAKSRGGAEFQAKNVTCR